MAACGSIVGCMVVDDRSSTRGGSEARFLKPIGVPHGDKTRLRAVRGSCYGGQGGGFQMGRRLMGFTVHQSSKDMKGSIGSLLNFDGVGSEVSRDGSLIYEQSNLRSQDGALKVLSGAWYLPCPYDVINGEEGAQGWGVSCGYGDSIRKSLNDDVDDLSMLLEKVYSELGELPALIVGLKAQNLIVISLGGLAFTVVRDGKSLISKSDVRIFPSVAALQHGNMGTLLNSGQIFEIHVVPGDAIVYGSKGLFENLSSKEIADIVDGSLNQNLSPNATAQRVAVVARERALDRRDRCIVAIGRGDRGAELVDAIDVLPLTVAVVLIA